MGACVCVGGGGVRHTQCTQPMHEPSKVVRGKGGGGVSAFTRLGGTVLSTESAGEYSSAAKGETLEGGCGCVCVCGGGGSI